MLFSHFIHYIILFSTDRFHITHAFQSKPIKKISTTPFSMSTPKTTPEEGSFIQEEPFTHKYSHISTNTTYDKSEFLTQKDFETLRDIKKMMKQYELLKILQSPHISQHHKTQLIDQYEIFSTAPYQPVNLFNGLDW